MFATLSTNHHSIFWFVILIYDCLKKKNVPIYDCFLFSNTFCIPYCFDTPTPCSQILYILPAPLHLCLYHVNKSWGLTIGFLELDIKVKGNDYAVCFNFKSSVIQYLCVGSCFPCSYWQVKFYFLSANGVNCIQETCPWGSFF